MFFKANRFLHGQTGALQWRAYHIAKYPLPNPTLKGKIFTRLVTIAVQLVVLKNLRESEVTSSSSRASVVLTLSRLHREISSAPRRLSLPTSGCCVSVGFVRHQSVRRHSQSKVRRRTQHFLDRLEQRELAGRRALFAAANRNGCNGRTQRLTFCRREAEPKAPRAALRCQPMVRRHRLCTSSVSTCKCVPGCTRDDHANELQWTLRTPWRSTRCTRTCTTGG